MSSDEELIAIGRLVTEHQSARSRLASLRKELLAIGTLLTRVGQAFTVGGGLIAFEPQVTAEEIDGLPTPAKLHGLLAELKEATKAEEALRTRLREADLQ